MHEHIGLTSGEGSSGDKSCPLASTLTHSILVNEDSDWSFDVCVSAFKADTQGMSAWANRFLGKALGGGA